MEIRFASDNTKELTKERKKAIKQYIDLQEDFTKLAKAGVCKHFIINYLNEELDVDSLTETQQTKLDNCKDKKTRELYIKELPQKEQEYPLFYITPYGIGDEVNRKDVTIDELGTEVIEIISERIKIKIDTYKEFI